MDDYIKGEDPKQMSPPSLDGNQQQENKERKMALTIGQLFKNPQFWPNQAISPREAVANHKDTQFP